MRGSCERRRGSRNTSAWGPKRGDPNVGTGQGGRDVGPKRGDPTWDPTFWGVGPNFLGVGPKSGTQFFGGGTQKWDPTFWGVGPKLGPNFFWYSFRDFKGERLERGTHIHQSNTESGPQMGPKMPGFAFGSHPKKLGPHPKTAPCGTQNGPNWDPKRPHVGPKFDDVGPKTDDAGTQFASRVFWAVVENPLLGPRRPPFWVPPTSRPPCPIGFI